MTDDITIGTRREELTKEFESLAALRRKQFEQSQNFIRYKDAAEALERLAKSVQDCPDDVISDFYEERCRLGPRGDELWNEMMENIGWPWDPRDRKTPKTAEAMLSRFIEDFLELNPEEEE